MAHTTHTLIPVNTFTARALKRAVWVDDILDDERVDALASGRAVGEGNLGVRGEEEDGQHQRPSLGCTQKLGTVIVLRPHSLGFHTAPGSPCVQKISKTTARRRERLRASGCGERSSMVGRDTRLCARGSACPRCIVFRCLYRALTTVAVSVLLHAQALLLHHGRVLRHERRRRRLHAVARRRQAQEGEGQARCEIMQSPLSLSIDAAT